MVQNLNGDALMLVAAAVWSWFPTPREPGPVLSRSLLTSDFGLLTMTLHLEGVYSILPYDHIAARVKPRVFPQKLVDGGGEP